jgi:hypothetical protein
MRTRLAIIIAMFLFVAISASDNSLYLVRDGKPTARIVISDAAPAVLVETANDFADVIRRMSGATLPVVRESSRSTTIGVDLILGRQPADTSLQARAYRVQRDGKHLIFSGGDDIGVVNGVYAFLSKELGCRWYIPGDLGTHIPQRTTITVDQLEMSDAPDFESVQGFGGYPDRQAGSTWLRRNGMSGFPNQYHGHNWYNLVPQSLASEHPDYFALYNGTRGDQLCSTHPDVIDSAAAVAIRYFDKYPYPMYSLSPNDNERVCQCERCLALDRKLGVDKITSKTGTFTPRLVEFCNRVAERVAKKHPDRYLAFYSYNRHTDPLPSQKLHPNLIPVVCKTPWNHCAHHAIDDPKCDRNRAVRDVIDGWNKVASKIYVYEYYGHWAWYGPYGIVHAIRRDLPWMRKHGVVGFNSETHANWWTQGLNFTVATRLFWNLDADVDTIEREYYQNLYGPAASHMMAYGQAYEKLMNGIPYDKDEEMGFTKHVTPEFLDGVGVLLASAEQALGNAHMSESQRMTIRKRLRKVRAGYRFTRAQATSLDMSATPASVIFTGGESVMDVLAEMEADSSLHDVIELDLARIILQKHDNKMKSYRDAWNNTTLSARRRAELKKALKAGDTRTFATGIGCVTDWHVIGMFGGATGKGMSTVCPPERNVDLTATYKGKYGPVRWVRHQTEDAFGMIDLRKYFAPQAPEDVITYLHTEIEKNSSSGVDPYMRLYVGSNDGMMIWHNGDLIYSTNVERRHTLDEDKLTIRLESGKNRFLVKVYNIGGGYGFSMRMMNWDFRPIKASVWE